MIRQATPDDLGWIEDTYNEHFLYEKEHGAFTVFQRDVYPTRRDAEKAITDGAMYVCAENGRIAGSIIVDRVQPAEYGRVAWGNTLGEDEVMVVHLLLVRPSMAGRGVASALVGYAVELAQNNGCRAVRLDTGEQNLPAVSLYKKLGFQIAAAAPMKVGGAIENRGHLFLQKILGAQPGL